jgi:F-box protein 11
LARSAYFLAFLSPKFLNSEECRRELERFLEIEEAAEHRDLILPIYFIETPEWADPDSAESSEIAGLVRTLKTRQTPDFGQLRGAPTRCPTSCRYRSWAARSSSKS